MMRLLAGVLALSMAFFGAAYSQDKKDDKTPTTIRGQLPQNYKKLGLGRPSAENLSPGADDKMKKDQLTQQLEKLKSDEKEAYEAVLTPEQLSACGRFAAAKRAPTRQKVPTRARVE